MKFVLNGEWGVYVQGKIQHRRRLVKPGTLQGQLIDQKYNIVIAVYVMVRK